MSRGPSQARDSVVHGAVRTKGGRGNSGIERGSDLCKVTQQGRVGNRTQLSWIMATLQKTTPCASQAAPGAAGSGWRSGAKCSSVDASILAGGSSGIWRRGRVLELRRQLQQEHLHRYF